MHRWNLLSVKTDIKTMGVSDICSIRLRLQLIFYGVPFALRYVTSFVMFTSFGSKFCITNI
ncbi:hypothetical protein T12_16510, partial [Trichinella patagoniensis]